VPNGERVRIEVGFDGGQVITGFVDGSSADQLERALQVHRVARPPVGQRGPAQRLDGHVRRKAAGLALDHRQAGAVHRDARALPQVFVRQPRADAQARPAARDGCDLGDAPDVLDQPGEHPQGSIPAAWP